MGGGGGPSRSALRAVKLVRLLTVQHDGWYLLLVRCPRETGSGAAHLDVVAKLLDRRRSCSDM
jgi:hypothetical protein